MKYSLKNQYKNLLFENSNTQISQGQIIPWKNSKTMMIGKFSQEAKNLWNYKDGSGGRGEYSVVYDILSNNDSLAAGPVAFTKIKKFFDGMQWDSEYSFDLKKCVQNENFDYYNVSGVKESFNLSLDSFKKFIADWFAISAENIQLVVENREPSEGIEWDVWKGSVTNKDDASPSAVIKIGKSVMKPLGKSAAGYVTINELNRAITKQAWLSLNKSKARQDPSFFQYSVLNSVTTSGEESKSCDIIISNDLLSDEQKSLFITGDNDLKIEVKEVKNWSDVVKQGIRLGGGSNLAVITGDIFFSIKTIAIACDFETEAIASLLEGDDDNIKAVTDILKRMRNGEINVDKFNTMLSMMQNKNFIPHIKALIASSNVSPPRKEVAEKCLALLKSKILNKTIGYGEYQKELASERSEGGILFQIQKELKDAIDNSIKADWFCIALGKVQNKSYSSKGTYMMIHKSGYKNYLMNAKISGGGTGYARLYDAPEMNALQIFFTNESLEENRDYALKLFNKGIFDKRVLKECFSNNRNNNKKTLKEVYNKLFKKKLISEGGLGGHMMHPYEALDMTPRQIIDRVKEYSTSQSIIEKVDGQNLFFTVEQDGTLMFARNKEDMTHDDLVTKFTGHPAELPFVEGGNAIKRGVDQWLSSAGSASEMEIREIFQPSGETKSFINFEIMHPDKPNQIIYDEKYIVFHSIVDFVNGRESAYSSNKSQRLQGLIKRMQIGVSSAGFTLASNRTVDLNQLSNVQIEDYVSRIKEATQLLQITEDEFLGDGIEKLIEKEIDELGVSISEKDLRILYDFVIYGETKSGVKIKSKDFMSSVAKYDLPKLRSIDVTSSAKALKKVQRIISPFKEIFVDLGIDLLKGVKSAYMSDDTNQMNIDLLKDKLQTAVDDLSIYTSEVHESEWPVEVRRLKPHLDKVIVKDIENIVSTAVEGGVYDHQGDLLKVTGGFAPMNQILGAAYRDKKGIFPTFKEKFMQQESNRRSLRSVFNLIY